MGESGGKWNTRLVERVKRESKDEVSAFAAGDPDPAKALRFIEQRIAALAEDQSDAGQLRRYVLVMTALVHHERFGLLSAPKLRKLTALAYALLKAQGVKPISSRLAFLYGELHLVLSQIHRKNGDHFRAAWEQQVSWHLSRHSPVGGASFQAMSLAIRSVRLGHADLALGNLALAADLAPKPEQAVRIALERVKTLRLSGDLEASAALGAATVARAELPENARVELAWEALCRDVQVSGDLQPMMRAIGRRSTHARAPYIVEAVFWAHAVRSTQWIKRLPSLRHLMKDKDRRPQRLGHFFRAAMTIIECHDYGIPFESRLQKLGAALSERSRLVTVDKELLLLAAATRWLLRSHLFYLAAITYREYQDVSRRLTGHGCDDALGIMGDLEGRSWTEAGEIPAAS